MFLLSQIFFSHRQSGSSLVPPPFLSYCLPATLTTASLVYQPMNWSHWLDRSYYRQQPSLICVPFSSLFFFTQPFHCCFIDRRAISHMNNASRETKIAALLSFGWDLFCKSLTECARADFQFNRASRFVKSNRDLDVKVLAHPSDWLWV